MRGRILQYNGSDGTGTIVADDQQYRFTIGVWKGSTAPVVGKAVDVIAENGQLTAVMVVPDDVLLREKTAEIGGKLNSFVSGLGAGRGNRAGPSAGGGLGAPVTAGGGAPVAALGGGVDAGFSAASVLARYGKVTLIAYAAFLLGTLAFNAVSISIMGQQQGRALYDIASLMSQLGGGSGIKLGLLLAYVSVVVPLLWRDRRAWLALAVPLLVLVAAVWSAAHAINAATGGLGAYGGDVAREMAGVFSLGFGFYLSLAAALVLAASGVKRFASAA